MMSNEALISEWRGSYGFVVLNGQRTFVHSSAIKKCKQQQIGLGSKLLAIETRVSSSGLKIASCHTKEWQDAEDLKYQSWLEAEIEKKRKEEELEVQKLQAKEYFEIKKEDILMYVSSKSFNYISNSFNIFYLYENEDREEDRRVKCDFSLPEITFSDYDSIGNLPILEIEQLVTVKVDGIVQDIFKKNKFLVGWDAIQPSRIDSVSDWNTSTGKARVGLRLKQNSGYKGIFFLDLEFQSHSPEVLDYEIIQKIGVATPCGNFEKNNRIEDETQVIGDYILEYRKQIAILEDKVINILQERLDGETFFAEKTEIARPVYDSYLVTKGQHADSSRSYRAGTEYTAGIKVYSGNKKFWSGEVAVDSAVTKDQKEIIYLFLIKFCKDFIKDKIDFYSTVADLPRVAKFVDNFAKSEGERLFHSLQ